MPTTLSPQAVRRAAGARWAGRLGLRLGLRLVQLLGQVLAGGLAAGAALAQATAPADPTAAVLAWHCAVGSGQAMQVLQLPVNLRERFPLATGACAARVVRRVEPAPAPTAALAAPVLPPAQALPPAAVSRPPPAPPPRDAGRALDGGEPPTRGPGATARHQAIVLEASRRHGLDPALVMAVIQVESGQDAQARSPKGALGLMQVMPATARRFGLQDPARLLNPHTNIEVGSRYLAYLQAMFDGRVDLMLAAYNAGEGAVMRHGMRVPPFAESQDYVRRVLARWRSEPAAPS